MKKNPHRTKQINDFYSKSNSHFCWSSQFYLFSLFHTQLQYEELKSKALHSALVRSRREFILQLQHWITTGCVESRHVKWEQEDYLPLFLMILLLDPSQGEEENAEQFQFRGDEKQICKGRGQGRKKKNMD